MPDSILVGLTAVLALGILAQWLAWRVRLPSILLLLVFGFAAGPGRLGLVDPQALLGDLLLPLVSISAALILFEGGLSLTVGELGLHRRMVRRLVTLGVLVTWGLASAAAYTLVGLPLGLSVLLGAVLSVSGPTVIQPLLRHVRPTGPVGPILKWEGIVIDPIGAVLAVLVFEGLLEGGFRAAASHGIFGVVRTIVVGGVLGAGSAFVLLELLKRYWIPDWLHNAFALALVVAAFTASNLLQEDAGLLTVTVFGVVLANRPGVSVRHIVEFKENLRVLLLSSVFILLAARLSLEDVARLDAGALAFLGALILFIRPLGVFLCAWGSSLETRERVFLAWVFPRGIVAAAVASVFALRLEGEPGAELMVPLTFLVIVGTVLVYGLTAGPLARRLGLSKPDPQGALMIGAHPWARHIAATLVAEGIPVRLVDTNRHNLAAARMMGLPTWYGNAVSEHALEEIDTTELGRLLALTPNDEVNTLAALHYVHEFGRERVYQLPLAAKDASRRGEVPSDLRGRPLFGEEDTFWTMSSRFARGAKVKATRLSDKFTYEDFRALHGERALPLFTVTSGKLAVATVGGTFQPKAGQTLIAVVEEDE